MDLTEKARGAYNDMVMVMEKEMAENPHRAQTGGVFPQLFAHLGHSRTPSACSAISFTSSILSEPISENYPHSEPETDSRGYEIVRVDKVDQAITSSPEEKDVGTDMDGRSESPNSSNASQGKIKIVETLHEIDEGNEADTEDFDNHNGHRKGSRREVGISSKVEDDKEKRELQQNEDDDDYDEDDDCDSDDDEDSESDSETDSEADSQDNSEDDDDFDEDRADTVRELPHIDSIHSSVVDLSSEILSQHSSKTLDLNTEVLSTHSSKTLGEGGINMGDLSERSNRTADPSPDGRDCTAGQKNKAINKERIESWVADTQQQMEKMHIGNSNCDGAVNSVCTSGANGVVVSLARSDHTPTPPPSCVDLYHQEDKLNDNTRTATCCVCDAQQNHQEHAQDTVVS